MNPRWVMAPPTWSAAPGDRFVIDSGAPPHFYLIHPDGSETHPEQEWSLEPPPDRDVETP